jgi:hypothetical protein
MQLNINGTILELKCETGLVEDLEFFIDGVKQNNFKDITIYNCKEDGGVSLSWETPSENLDEIDIELSFFGVTPPKMENYNKKPRYRHLV